MQYDDFLATVQERDNLDSREYAAAITRATLETLAERVQGDSANNLASQLPHELAVMLQRAPGSTGEQFPVDEFIRRIAERADIESDQAILQVRGVLEALSVSVSEGQVNHLWAELPGEYLSLWEPARDKASTDAVRVVAPADRRV